MHACCHFSHVRVFVTPWTIACQAPLSMGFCRQEYWGVVFRIEGLSCPSPGESFQPGEQTASPETSALQVDSLPTEPPGETQVLWGQDICLLCLLLCLQCLGLCCPIDIRCNYICNFKFISSHIKIQSKESGEIYFKNVFSLTQYIQNAVISAWDQYTGRPRFITLCRYCVFKSIDCLH